MTDLNDKKQFIRWYYQQWNEDYTEVGGIITNVRSRLNPDSLHSTVVTALNDDEKVVRLRELLDKMTEDWNKLTDNLRILKQELNW